MTDDASKRPEMVVRLSGRKVVVAPAWTLPPRAAVAGNAEIKWEVPRGVGRPITPRVIAAELARFLAARPWAKEPEHKKAAQDAGFKFSDRQWRRAYAAMPKQSKAKVGRPRKSGGM